MYLVFYKANGYSTFEAFDDEDRAVGFAVRKKGYVVKSTFPVKEEK